MAAVDLIPSMLSIMAHLQTSDGFAATLDTVTNEMWLQGCRSFFPKFISASERQVPLWFKDSRVIGYPANFHGSGCR